MQTFNQTTYDKFKQVIPLKIKKQQRYYFDEICIHLFMGEFTKLDLQAKQPPIMWITRPLGTDIEQYELYFPTQLIPPSFQKPVLLHEIAEINYYHSNHNQNTPLEVTLRDAHQNATLYEEAYIQEKLTLSQQNIYFKWREILQNPTSLKYDSKKQRFKLPPDITLIIKQTLSEQGHQ